MHTATPHPFRRLALSLALAAGMAGCSTLEVQKQTVKETAAARLGPESAPQRSITGFAPALRCMDNLMIDYGVRDLSMLVEDILDQTKKVNVGTRDMLISAVSDMTRRSRSVRLVAFGKDATNAISFLQSAQRQSAYEVIPQYDIKGSVSQFDENVIRNQKDMGIGFQPFINLGISRDAASSVMGLDLSVLTTDDLSILPGVTSRNSVVILKSGKGLDGDAAYHKFGVSYSMNLSKSEGNAQALRGLVELAVVELMGKLTKTPYWRCLNGDPASNPDIRQELSDWYFGMAANPMELIGYFQNQLRQRGYYQGPVDGKFNPAIDEAIAAYRVAVGLSNEAVLDEALFNAYLAADHAKTPRPVKAAVYTAPEAAPGAAAAVATAAPAQPAAALPAAPAAAAPVAAAAPSAVATRPLALSLSTANNQTRFASGESITLTVRPTQDAHVYCYLQDETAKITRFFPNRFSKDSFVSAARPLTLPGTPRFEITMNNKGVKEEVACFATPRDVMAQLPATVVGVDLEPLAVSSMDQIRTAFAKVSSGTLVQEKFHVQSR
jgi:Domain of unknown function (DUF4384)/Putative peptidoglycan binding domain